MRRKLDRGTLNDFLATIKDMKRCKTRYNDHIFASSDGKTFVELIGVEGYAEYVWSTKHVREGKSLTSAGYHMIHTRRGNRLPHRLVAEAWLLPDDDLLDDFEVDHIDGDKTNNNVDNLELVTHKENMLRAWATGLIKTPPTNRGRYYQKTETLITPDGARIPMTQKEYVAWRLENNLPLKGWMTHVL